MQQSNQACELQLLGPCTQSPCSPSRDATAVRSPRTAARELPRSLQLEGARTATKTHTAKKKESDF